MPSEYESLTSVRKPLDGIATFSMIVLCAIWGLQQVAVKAVASDVSPVLQISLRSAIAALLVGALMVTRRESFSVTRKEWLPGLVIGVLFAFEFLFVGEGLRYTTASHAVMFLYTAPVFAALGLHLRLPSERLRPIQWLGVILALVGVIVTFLGRSDSQTAVNAPLGDLLALLAGLSYGATTVVVRTSSLSEAPASRTLLYQLIGAFLILFTVAAVSGQTGFRATPPVIGSLLFQSVIVSFATFLAWFMLLRKYLATRLGILSFMTPLFGILFGALLLREPLEARFLAGASIVFVGILLVSGHEWLEGLLGRRTSTA